MVAIASLGVVSSALITTHTMMSTTSSGTSGYPGTRKGRGAMAERRSPLAGAADRLAKVSGAITMAEVPFLTQLDVRRNQDAPAGFPFPAQPCTSVRSGDADVLWLGPDEWLVVGPPGAAERLTKVRWGVLGEMAWGWALTIPMTMLAGALVYWLLSSAFGR